MPVLLPIIITKWRIRFLPGSEVGIPASKASEYYKIAYDAAKAVIDGGVYVLQNNISDKADNFYAATTLKDNNTEVIWARDYKGPSNYQGWTRDNVPSSHAEDIDQAYLGPVLNLVEDFEYIGNRDGKLNIKILTVAISLTIRQ